MKLEKLLTLSQFVDLIEHIELSYMDRYVSIKKYNNFLKQPLKKEMFVNKLEKPKPIDELPSPDPSMLKLYKRLMTVYQEAEKKVIFKGWENTKAEFSFTKTSILLDYTENGILKCRFIKTINDLAEATKGKLELKNVEL